MTGPTATAERASATRPPAPPPRRRRTRPARVVLQCFLVLMAIGWLFPLAWAVLNSFRDYAYTAANGYVSLGGWTLDNYREA